MPDSEYSNGHPMFSVVSAVYNVATYLPAFIDSLRAQRRVEDRKIEFIMVDDGSTDNSLELLENWANEDERVHILRQSNSGQGAARNAGLAIARGEWVTFPDPDDLLSNDYFWSIGDYVDDNPDVEIVAANFWLWRQGEPEPSDDHPLRYRFFGDGGPRDLLREPEYFIGSAPAAFFRRDIIVEAGLTFDERIMPNFEDGHFCIRYLLELTRPKVGFAKRPIYVYRKREDNSSTLQNSLTDPGRYTVVPRLGYLDSLSRGAEKFGKCPAWIQNHILYELSYYFQAEDRMSGAATAAMGKTGTEFVRQLSNICAFFEPEIVDSYRINHLAPAWRAILGHRLRDPKWTSSYAVITEIDPKRGLAQVAYRHSSEYTPRVEYIQDGNDQQPVATKVRSLNYFGVSLLSEHVSWLSADMSIRIVVDGHPVKIFRRWPKPEPDVINPWDLWHRGIVAAPEAANMLGRVKRFLIRWLAATRIVRRRFAGAWVLLDRIHDCGDSGERLFEYLRKERRDINAWFVLEKGSPDWKRLRKCYRQRVVPHNSLRWLILMLNSAILISSHIDNAVYNPPRLQEFGPSDRRFVFLQHGVIKDDLSRWLNPKRLALMVTSTPDEHSSIVSDGSPYRFTELDVVQSGLPRFDRLLALAANTVAGDRRWILVAPTWRNWLTMPLSSGSQRRTLVEGFEQSQYYREWYSFLASEELYRIAQATGTRIGFLPHPNLQSAIGKIILPAHVVALRYEDNDIQQLIADTRVMVTDYSSMVFNAAYVEIPVVYFQFDRELVESGGHVGRSGYYDYRTDGFGPVVETVEGAVAAVRSFAPSGKMTREFRNRAESAFPVRDGGCCRRTTEAIEALR